MFSTYTFSNLKDDLLGPIGGVDLAKIQNLNNLVQRSGRRLLSKVDLPSTKRKHLITLFDNVYDYSVPSDDDFKKVFDLRPQVQRSILDNFSGRFSEEFDKKKASQDSLISTEWQDGVQFFRITRNVNSRKITLDNLDTIDNWVVQVDGANLTTDTINKAKGSASLNFDLSGAGTNGGIVNTNLTTVDLTVHDEISSLFLWVFLPSASAITSLGLRWGNSSSVYWERVVTTPHFGSFVNGWNLIRFDWNGATETGTVDHAKIDYSRINIIYDGTADTDFRVDDLTSRIGHIYELWYYSKFLFRTTGGSWKNDISNNDDIINIDDDYNNLIVFECLSSVGVQLQDEELKADAKEELASLYEDFRKDYPSEGMKKLSRYYKI